MKYLLYILLSVMAALGVWFVFFRKPSDSGSTAGSSDSPILTEATVTKKTGSGTGFYIPIDFGTDANPPLEIDLTPTKKTAPVSTGFVLPNGQIWGADTTSALQTWYTAMRSKSALNTFLATQKIKYKRALGKYEFNYPGSTRYGYGYIIDSSHYVEVLKDSSGWPMIISLFFYGYGTQKVPAGTPPVWYGMYILSGNNGLPTDLAGYPNNGTRPFN